MSIQFNCQKHFSFKLFSLVKQFYFKQFNLAWVCSLVLLNPIRCYYSGQGWTWERLQWRGTLYSPKLQHYRNVTIRLFCVISRSYPSAEVQSVYSTAPADWAIHQLKMWTYCLYRWFFQSSEACVDLALLFGNDEWLDDILLFDLMVYQLMMEILRQILFIYNLLAKGLWVTLFLTETLLEIRLPINSIKWFEVLLFIVGTQLNGFMYR